MSEQTHGMRIQSLYIDSPSARHDTFYLDAMPDASEQPITVK